MGHHIQLERRSVLSRREGELWIIESPVVGWLDGAPRDGALVGAGSAVGTLQCLSRRWVLELPDGCRGRVREAGGPALRSVGYRERLFVLDTVGLGGEDPARSAASASAADTGGLAVRAPTDGVFYSRASPDAAPFVAPGDPLRRGQPLGLIEVMKTFNQVLYGGPGLPERGIVVELRAGDGAEVRAGDPLILVRAAD